MSLVWISLAQRHVQTKVRLKAWEIFKIVSSLPSAFNPSVRRLCRSIACSLCLFNFNFFRWSTAGVSFMSSVWVNSRLNEYIDYNVKIRQIVKIDKSILMAIQQRKIYIFHRAWDDRVFSLLLCLVFCFASRFGIFWLCSVSSLITSDLWLSIFKPAYNSGDCRFVTELVNMSWLGSIVALFFLSWARLPFALFVFNLPFVQDRCLIPEG